MRSWEDSKIYACLGVYLTTSKFTEKYKAVALDNFLVLNIIMNRQFEFDSNGRNKLDSLKFGTDLCDLTIT